MFSRFKKWTVEHQWSVFIILALVIATASTGVSLWLYRASGTARLDLSRPGYEKVREEVQDDNDNTKPFPPTGPLDDATIEDFRLRYKTVSERLDQMNNYDNAVMSDENLGFADSPAVTEPIE